jgi:hypothetical protein
MAQRVYLIPIKPELTAAFCTLVRAPAAREDELWERLRRHASRQATLSALSCERARGLDLKKFIQVGRENDFYEYSNSRPYCVTGAAAVDAVKSVKALRACRNAAEAAALLDAEMQALGPLWAPPENVDELHESTAGAWHTLQEEVQRLKQIRACFKAGQPFSIRVLKELEMEGSGLRAFDADESEEREIACAHLPALYGRSLGSALGRLAGLCEPTWWMGRNYWIGLLIHTRLGTLAKVKYSKLCKRIAAAADSPASLFADVALPGYAAGLSLSCDAYATGLYFAPAHIGPLLASLQEQRSDWEALSAQVTGYTPDQVAMIVRMVEEALWWAHDEGCGLIEGDELVGCFGSR